MITLTDVTKRYDRHEVLRGVDLTIPRGSLTAVVGPNGAGKSTLLSVVSRLVPADTGQVRIGHLTLGEASDAEIARTMAVLRQENVLTARLSVVDLVRFGRFPYGKGRLGPDDHRIVAQAIEFVELTEYRDRYLDQLSGGQRQRAFIAMVLAQDTEYVLLDEPLNNLDIRHSVQTMRRLRAMVDDLGKTVAVVLHDVNFAAAHADHIIAMRDGAVVAAGPPEDIITPAVLHSIYDIDIDVVTSRGMRVAAYFR
ncbi:ABC transporter ATP-binding protein [Gordonia sinesedis]